MSFSVLRKGDALLLLGGNECVQLLHSAVLSALTAEEGNAFWIDGCNAFNPYTLVEAAERYGMDADGLLQRIFIARAFTAHQLNAIAALLPEKAVREHASIIAVAGVAELFVSDVRWQEGLDMLSSTIANLLTAARHAHCWLLLSTEAEKALVDMERYAAIHTIARGAAFSEVSVDGADMFFTGTGREMQASLSDYGAI
jgi:hypothetical protein